MKSVCIAAVLVLASQAAHAGSSIAFDVDGHTIRITAPRNCQSLSCLQISGIDLQGLTSGGRGADDDDALRAAPASAPSAAATVTAPAAPMNPPATAPAPATPAPVAATAVPPAVTPATAASTPAPVATGTATPAAPATTAPAASAAAPSPEPNSPVGLWATEDNKGNVRIEPCGANLCGFAEKSGEKILINMKPKENKWVGRIHDPDGGGNYDSTIALKGPNTLRVQGCAFGGLFCGGQTWKRIG